MASPSGSCLFRRTLLWLAWLLVCLLPLGAQPTPLGTAGNPLLVGVNRDYPPYEFTNAKGDPDGYDVDLVKAAAKAAGLEIIIVPAPWDQVRSALAKGSIHLAPGMLKSGERARYMDFCEPHTRVHYSLFGRKNASTPQSLEKLRGRRILVERGSQMHEQLLELGYGQEAVPVESEPETLRQLAAGQGDAALAPLLLGLMQIREKGLTNLKALGAPLFERELCFAFAKGHPELKGQLEVGFDLLKQSGEYRRIHDKWFGGLLSRAPSLDQILWGSLWVIVPSLLALAAVLAWNRTLRRKVAQATTALQEANRNLAQREGLLNAVIDSMPLMLFVKDPNRDFRFTVWNTKAEELIGVPKERILGRTDYEIMATDKVAKFREADQRVLDSGQLMDIPEETVDTPRGPVLLHTIKVPVRDEQGRPQFLLGISEDIRLFKHIEEELRRSQVSLAEAQRIARIGNWELDTATGALRWSDEFFRILGLNPVEDEPAFERFVERLHPEDSERVQGLLRRVTETGNPVTIDHRLLLPEGQERHLISHIEAVRDPEGKLLRLMGTSQDITERRTNEDALRQTQRLESLGVLAGGIAHDFNNLLTAIMGNLNLVQLHVDEEHEATPYLRKIETTISRAANLARQMLAYSGRGTFIIRPLDLNHVVREMTHLLEVSLSKKVRMEFVLDPTISWIDGDEGQIQQVVMNLVTNASEAIGDQPGLITLTTSEQEVGEATMARFFAGRDAEPGRYVVFEVADTGCGMTPEVQARLFEPFFTTKFSGRGLGLSAMQGIIKAHGGCIHVDSEPGKGSRFRLYFPLSERTGHVMPVSEKLVETPVKATLLIADDEPVIRTSTSEMLENMGYTVLQAADGLEAVECFRAHRHEISLVLLDLTMPRLDGREALREILALAPGTKVILCSGYHQQEALQGTEALSVAGFLPKPYRMRELKAMIDKALAG